MRLSRARPGARAGWSACRAKNGLVDMVKRSTRLTPVGSREPNYHPLGATRIAETSWRDDQPGFRRLSTRVEIGRGQDCWEQSKASLFAWEVKTRSGFTVATATGEGSLVGHPVSGEEAFILDRTPDGVVWLTLRSLTQPPGGPWCLAYPFVLIAQRWYRRRYQRALRTS